MTINIIQTITNILTENGELISSKKGRRLYNNTCRR